MDMMDNRGCSPVHSRKAQALSDGALLDLRAREVGVGSALYAKFELCCCLSCTCTSSE